MALWSTTLARLRRSACKHKKREPIWHTWHLHAKFFSSKTFAYSCDKTTSRTSNRSFLHSLLHTSHTLSSTPRVTASIILKVSAHRIYSLGYRLEVNDKPLSMIHKPL